MMSLQIIILMGLLPPLGWLFWSHLKLKHNHAELIDRIDQNTEDLEGLCTAAINVDREIVINRQQLLTLMEKINQSRIQKPQHPPDTPAPDQRYQDIIHRVKNGAEVDELVNEFSLSKDEATLLVSLHHP
ncbi:MAG: DUF2802 domain-containing protein [Methylococcaceae bacterium]